MSEEQPNLDPSPEPQATAEEAATPPAVPAQAVYGEPMPNWNELHPMVRMVVIRALEVEFSRFQFEEARHEATTMGMMSQMAVAQQAMAEQAKTPADGAMASGFGAAASHMEATMIGGQSQAKRAIVAAFQAAITKLAEGLYESNVEKVE